MTSTPVTVEPSAAGRAALLAAAHAELVEHGATALSLRAVARRAGLSHAAPKHHFRDRQGLLTAVAADGFRLFGEALARAAVSGDPDERLAAMGRAYLDFGRSHPALLDLMFRGAELDRDDPEYLASGRAAFALLVTAVDDVAPTGAMSVGGPPPGPSDNALMTWAFIHGLVVLGRSGATIPGHGAFGDEADRLVDVMVRRMTS